MLLGWALGLAAFAAVILLGCAGCGQRPAAAASEGLRYVVTHRDVGGRRGACITDNDTGRRYVVHHRGHTVAIAGTGGSE